MATLQLMEKAQLDALEEKFLPIPAIDLIANDYAHSWAVLVGTSKTTLQDAIVNAIGRANIHIDNVRWFKLLGTRSEMDAHNNTHWQVRLQAGFFVEDSV